MAGGKNGHVAMAVHFVEAASIAVYITLIILIMVSKIGLGKLKSVSNAFGCFLPIARKIKQVWIDIEKKDYEDDNRKIAQCGILMDNKIFVLVMQVFVYTEDVNQLGRIQILYFLECTIKLK